MPRSLLLLLTAACTAAPSPTPAPPDDPPVNEVPAPLREPVVTAQRLTRRQLERLITEVLPGVPLYIAAQYRDLPPEPERHGFDNHHEADGVSAAWVDRAEQIAVEAAARWVGESEELRGCRGRDAACVVQAVAGVATRAWRRPVREEELGWIEEVVGFGGGEARAGLELGVAAVLQDPAFFYQISVSEPAPEEASRLPLTGESLAAKLALTLLGAPPTSALIAAADGLGAPERLREVAAETMQDARFGETVAAMHHQWLDLDLLQSLYLDHERYFPGLRGDAGPGYAEATGRLARDLRLQAEQFVTSAVIDGGWSQLTGGRSLWISPTLASEVHAGELAALGLDPMALPGAPFTLTAYTPSEGYQQVEGVLVELPADRRSGVFTLPGLHAGRGDGLRSSVVDRGLWVLRRALCEEVGAPPAGVETVLTGSGSAREALERHAADPSCAACHDRIDPLGLPWESYDLAGAWREQEGGVPIEPAADLGAFGWQVDGALGLAGALSADARVRACYVRQWARYLHGGKVDEALVQDVAAAFAVSGEVQTMVLDLVASEAFSTVEAP